MGFICTYKSWHKAFPKKLHLTCLIAWTFKCLDGLSHRICFTERDCLREENFGRVLVKHQPIKSISLRSTATAHHPWCLHLDAQQQQESGICPHRLQGPALFPCQWADGQTLWEDQNSFPQSKSALFLTQRWEISAFPESLSILHVCPCLWLFPNTFKGLRTDSWNTLSPLDSNCDLVDHLEAEYSPVFHYHVNRHIWKGCFFLDVADVPQGCFNFYFFDH